MDLQPFTPAGDTVTLAVTTSSDRVALTALPGGFPEQTVIVSNVGSATAFVEFGGATIEADDATSMPIPAGTSVVFSLSSTLGYIAAITASSSTTLYATSGSGVPYGFGGGSAGGGGGGGDVNLIEVGGAAIALGQATMANSLPVVIASNQTGLLVAGASTPSDNFANPTTAVPAFALAGVWDGSNWGRLPGTSADGALVNLGANNDVTLNASQNSVGNVGGKTVAVTVTPPVTATNAYGINYVVGGLLTFSNAFTSAGSGIIQTVTVTIAKVETVAFTLYLFNANPSNTTWTDAAVAAINAADVAKVRPPIVLTNASQLGTHTVSYAAGIGEAMNVGSTTLYGVLIVSGALTNQFGSTSDVTVTVTILQDL